MNQEVKKNTRQDWVDIAKGIAIVAVVIGHIGYRWPSTKLLPLSDICVWIWHVPVFFMIGGFFLKEEKLQMPLSFVKGKIKSLYMPMIYIYVPILLLHNVFINIGWYNLNVDYYGKFVTWWGVGDFLKHLVVTLVCAGREPLLGAMWFGFVLFMALCFISFASWGISAFCKKRTYATYEITRFLVFLSLAIISCTLTKFFGFTIPRFNNTLVAIWLIYVGMLLVNKTKVTFSNGLITAICALVAWHSATVRGGVNLVANDYSDVIVLTVTSSACLYVICYLSKKLAKVKLLRVLLSKVGRESLYIMGLHFIGFKIASLLLQLIGCDVNLSELVPRIGNNVLYLLLYIVFGVGVPMIIISAVRMLRKILINRTSL